MLQCRYGLNLSALCAAASTEKTQQSELLRGWKYNPVPILILSHFSLLLSDSLPGICVCVCVWKFDWYSLLKTGKQMLIFLSETAGTWYFFHLIFSIFCLIEEKFCSSIFKMQTWTAVILGLLSDKWAVSHCCFSNWYPAFKWITCIISLFSLNSEILHYFPLLSLTAVFWGGGWGGLYKYCCLLDKKNANRGNFFLLLCVFQLFHVKRSGDMISPECCSPPCHCNSIQVCIAATLSVRCTFCHLPVRVCMHIRTNCMSEHVDLGRQSTDLDLIWLRNPG